MLEEFIVLTQAGVGPLMVRHIEITAVEPTFCGYSKIYLSNGNTFIVVEDPLYVHRILRRLTASETAPTDANKG
jgi:hypothetical protein